MIAPVRTSGDGAAAPIEVRVSLSGLKIRDLRLFDEFKNGTAPMSALVEFLDRVVVGGASELPLTLMPEIMRSVQTEVEALANPK